MEVAELRFWADGTVQIGFLTYRAAQHGCRMLAMNDKTDVLVRWRPDTPKTWWKFHS